MDIKRIQAAQPFQVNTAIEATDDERRRDQRDQASKAKEKKVTAPAAATNQPPPDASGTETSELCRQIVDSEKVLQLLELRPNSVESTKHKLLRLQSAKPLPAQQKNQKHINRAL